jgi:hypothetical protein
MVPAEALPTLQALYEAIAELPKVKVTVPPQLKPLPVTVTVAPTGSCVGLKVIVGIVSVNAADSMKFEVPCETST